MIYVCTCTKLKKGIINKLWPIYEISSIIFNYFNNKRWIWGRCVLFRIWKQYIDSNFLPYSLWTIMIYYLEYRYTRAWNWHFKMPKYKIFKCSLKYIKMETKLKMANMSINFFVKSTIKICNINLYIGAIWLFAWYFLALQYYFITILMGWLNWIIYIYIWLLLLNCKVFFSKLYCQHQLLLIKNKQIIS